MDKFNNYCLEGNLDLAKEFYYSKKINCYDFEEDYYASFYYGFTPLEI